MQIFKFIAVILFLGCGLAFAADAVPAVAYFPVLPFDAASAANPQLVPIASNYSLDGDHKGITRVIIGIHDHTRDASATLATLSALAGNANEHTLILVPQFMLKTDLDHFSNVLPDNGKAFASWQLFDWSIGDDSISSAMYRGISSFTVVDLLLMYVSDHDRFPDLDTIVVTGYGLGANFVQRYAAFGLASDTISRQNVTLRYVLAAPTSYLYLTSNRSLDAHKGFGHTDNTSCPDFDAYPYGLEKLNPYTRRVGANAAKMNYSTRDITYLSALGVDIVADVNCAAMLEGSNSYNRMIAYDLYLQSLYGDTIENTQTFSAGAQGKNDAVSLWGSSCGVASLFGDGQCPHTFGENK